MLMTVQSSIYLAGNKRKLFKKIKPHLQDGNRKVLLDLFGGSSCVSINSTELFDNIICNEKAWFLHGLHKWVKTLTPEEIERVEQINSTYEHNLGGYLKLREDYNKDGCKDYAMLYNLQCRSNSNMMRFSSKGFNMPFGKRHRCDTDRLMTHRDLIQKAELWNEDFADAIERIMESGDLSGTTVYLDPPYGGGTSTATYNENSWDDNDNTTLLEYCVELQKRGAKVVISNVFENRGKVHQELIDWCEEHKDVFEVHHLNMDYNNSSFRKGKGKTDEVLIVSK